ncbi:uncharacterized protein LAESUDRAFT_729710 [Laetiporus sulphureus 93-53]|uniref:Uncharacterized protein n=1 Tax=Laetiporus sulphureus 93-53 TaxID=1314785 RepID=A0A165CKP9_9APHY|nr:uncharacterized protein LAESUDRAFT_729710 [Laetiporus sulphureus 93-53]KZT02983.1 hypothetical protein LAESUDRAFT_729710 [Laetiporus sulphureus 93-53]
MIYISSLPRGCRTDDYLVCDCEFELNATPLSRNFSAGVLTAQYNGRRSSRRHATCAKYICSLS